MLKFTMQTIKEGLEGHAVSWYSEVFDLVFPNLDRQKANTCKICEWTAEQKKKDDSESKEDDD